MTKTMTAFVALALAFGAMPAFAQLSTGRDSGNLAIVSGGSSSLSADISANLFGKTGNVFAVVAQAGSVDAGVDLNVNLGASPSADADVNATIGGSDGTSADADVNVNVGGSDGTDANASVNVGTGDDGTSSNVEIIVGSDTDTGSDSDITGNVVTGANSSILVVSGTEVICADIDWTIGGTVDIACLKGIKLILWTEVAQSNSSYLSVFETRASVVNPATTARVESNARMMAALDSAGFDALDVIAIRATSDGEALLFVNDVV